MLWLLAAIRLILLILVLLLGIICASMNRLFSKQIYPPLKQFWFKAVAFCLGIRIQKHGFSHAYDGQPGCLYVCNHISWADIVVIGACVPRVVFLSKQEVAHWPVFGFLARIAGTLFIKRGTDAQAVCDKIAARLQVGGRVVIFPEGRTSTGETVKPFFPRLFKAAQTADASVQPLAIRYVNRQGLRFHDVNFADERHVGASLLQTVRQPYICAQIASDAPLMTRVLRNELAEQSRDFALKWVEKRAN